MAKPQTYEEFLKATGQPDSEAAKRSYGNAAMAQAGAGVTPPGVDTTALKKADAERLAQFTKPIENAASAALHLFPPTAVPTLIYDAVKNATTKPAKADTADIPQNP